MSWKRLLSTPILVYGVVLFKPPPPLFTNGCPSTPSGWNQIIGAKVNKFSKTYGQLDKKLERQSLLKNFLIDTKKAAITCKGKKGWPSTESGSCIDNIINFDRENTALSEWGTKNFATESTSIPKSLLNKNLLDSIAKARLDLSSKHLESLITQGVLPAGTKYTPFKASFKNVLDKSNLRRFMVLIPGNPKKYFTYFVGSTEARDKGDLPLNLSVVAVVNKAGKFESHYSDNKPIGHGATEASKIGNQDCNGCHIGSPLPPADNGLSNYKFSESLNRRFRENFQSINESIHKDSVAIGNHYNNSGPDFGEDSYPVDLDLIKQCTKSIQKKNSGPSKFLDSQIMNSLANNMNCKNCHSKDSRSNSRPIHWYTFANNWSYIKSHILSGAMPRNTKHPAVRVNLDEPQRQHLLECIKIWAFGENDSPGAFGEWVKDQFRCSDTPTQPILDQVTSPVDFDQ